ncbi:DUF2271 domain-containing protein [Kordiimonas sp. SCSIO 12603]|uniref:DUF2271 domain-containing protein n=1 Tax=Kordiimonas sp. SCSIO 12603 TaxID=2829596 RepID=UPI00210339AE|nr:DUF2271 domain-containing protein [Kordiimonas sp. SCSIO 12603]UTW60253.1 DUF2271 domain-containing protein [Kordiimonas sp. SCSIO 12603]
MMVRLRSSTILASLGIISGLVFPLHAETVSDHRENILGTSFDMVVHGAKKETATKAIEAAVLEIKRLQLVFSPAWKNSELAELNAGQVSISKDMQLVLEACEYWQEQTKGNLSCQLGNIKAMWADAVKSGNLPDKAELDELLDKISRTPMEISEGAVDIHGIKLDPTALSKGYILDSALKVARSYVPEATGIKLDIGGDALYWGGAVAKPVWTIGIANPFDIADNAGFMATLTLSGKAVASSGHRTRTFSVGGQNYSQIIDPKTGWPVENAPAATVVADDAMTADALATALSVMPIGEGLQLIDSLAGVEALIVSPDGRQFPSKGWHKLLAANHVSNEVAWKNDFRFKVNFDIPDKDEGNYKRPYVGIWVTDTKRELVRSLLLLGTSKEWMEETYVWWRRYGRKVKAVVDGVTRPTRMPGKYNITWDGRDDYGKPVNEGDYILHIEVAREHGGHTYRQIPISMKNEAFSLTQAAEGELGDVAVYFGENIKR